MTDFPVKVTPDWLWERLGSANLKVLDATWYLPGTPKDGLEEFKADRIQGASYFDFDRISDPNSTLPHMLPSEAGFAAAASELGIATGSEIVVYDRSGVFSAPRVWWMFKAFGHERIAVLDGGIPAWLASGYPLDTSPVLDAVVRAPAVVARDPPPTSDYTAKLQPGLVRSWEQVLDNVKSKQLPVLDARPAGRFDGSLPEVRPGLRSGHIPGSLSLPASEVLQDGRLKSSEALRGILADLDIDLTTPLITSCGSGVTACILAWAFATINPDVQCAVYDGSWTEWGGREDLPIET